MKSIHLRLLIFGLFAIGILIATRCSSDPDVQELTYDTVSTSPDSLCIADPSWFPHAKTPDPEEGDHSPFDDSVTSNQIFHQWSWQKFLWLTKPDRNNAPLFLNQSIVRQVSAYMDEISIPSGTTVQLVYTNQAGRGNPTLQTNPDYNSGNGGLVYYSLHVNRVMYAAAVKFAQDLGHSLDSNNLVSFPVHSFELKVAWLPTSAIPMGDRANYFTTTASLSTDNGVTFRNTEVALIGMHIVGVVKNHPEFIWATFEHDDLAPNYDWRANKATSQKDLPLFKKSTTGISGIGSIKYNTTTKLGDPPYQIFDLFQYGIPRNTDGTFMATSQAEPINYDNVQGINNCVKSQLKDVWKNYFYNGSLWLNMDNKTPEEQAQLIVSLGNNLHVSTPNSSTRGSVNCANVTMETFTQTFQSDISKINVNSLANCFSCHTAPLTNTASSPLYLSHTFDGYLSKKQGLTVPQIEAIKTRKEEAVFLHLRK